MNEMTHMLFFKKIFLKILIHVSVGIILVNGYGQDGELGPEFVVPLDNITVVQGRDITFTCVVKNAQDKVGWVFLDSSTPLAAGMDMWTGNPRLSVTHNGHNTWKLHISNVQVKDSGSYLCTVVNSEPTLRQSGYLNVLAPPEILKHCYSNQASIGERITNESGTIHLECLVTGVPEPRVFWRRTEGKDIILRSEGRENQIVRQVESKKLVMHQVQRTDMGVYLCIASNGVPPSVSKRFDVQVNFSPSVKVVYQIIAAPINSSVLLQCIVEAFPQPLHGWYKNDRVKLDEGTKYIMSEAVSNSYVWHLNLTIKNLQRDDYGTYICSSLNALGKSEGRTKLQELRLPTKPTTTATPHIFTTVKTPRVKEQLIPNHIEGDEIIGPVEDRTEIEKTRITETPPSPSTRPPLRFHSGNNSLHLSGTTSSVILKLLIIKGFYLNLYL